MRQEMKIVTILIAVALTCTLTEGKELRRQRGTNELKQSYIVHFNKEGEPLRVAGFDEFVRVLNRQQAIPGLKASSYLESPKFPFLQATPTTVSELMTTTEPTTSHQPRPLATGTSGTPGYIDSATTFSKPTYVSKGSTLSPLKLPHGMSGESPMPEASVSTNKPTLTLALGHDAATATSVSPEGEKSLSDVSNLVTPGENSPSTAMTVTAAGLGFSQETGLTSKVISLQPGVQTVLNYALPQVTSIQGYLPAQQTSYVHNLPTIFQKSYAPSTQPEIFNYASYPNQNQNIAIDAGRTPLQIVRQPAPLIDIGQGLGQGYRSAPQELPISLGGWGGVDYSGQRSIRLANPVLNVDRFRYRVPASSPGLSRLLIVSHLPHSVESFIQLGIRSRCCQVLASVLVLGSPQMHSSVQEIDDATLFVIS